MSPEAIVLVDRLGLVPHPEGGWYRETFRSTRRVTTATGASRSAATSIYFLLTNEAFSAFHRIASDETWHFYRGDPLTIEIIDGQGALESRVVGIGDMWQTTVPAGAYFASHVDTSGGYALVGCDVAPGFEFEDFELAERARLRALYPEHTSLIDRYTRVRPA